ncbi:MAG: hypothetical protein ABI567_00530 [Gammaproteobacteria bacterium]
MLAFSIAVSVALVVSFLCSIFGSVLLSTGHARIEALARDGKRSGLILRYFKRNIDVPQSLAGGGDPVGAGATPRRA